MILWRNIDFSPLFIILIKTPDFPNFYYMLGGNLGSLLYGDVSVMSVFLSLVCFAVRSGAASTFCVCRKSSEFGLDAE